MSIGHTLTEIGTLQQKSFDEFEKLSSGNRSAGTRLRKLLMEIKKAAAVGRKEVTEHLKSIEEARAAEKKAGGAPEASP